MINYVTVHHECDKWVDLQYEFIRRYTEEPFRIYTWMDNVNNYKAENYYRIVNNSEKQNEEHGLRLDFLSRLVINDSDDPDDLIIFIDGDAFPIKKCIKIIYSYLKKNILVSVQRLENGDNYPHPIFCAIKVGEWLNLVEKYDASWRRFEGEYCQGDPDTGCKIYNIIKTNKLEWYKMHRTNRINFHPVFYAIYGNMVYHHGAGFRKPRCRKDRDDIEIKNYDWYFIDELNTRMHKLIYEFIREKNDDIIEYLRG